MFATAAGHTACLVRNRHILAIQDTTTLRDDGDQRSTVLHPTIAVDADQGSLLGLVHAEVLRREGGRRAERKRLAFTEKESHRWLRGTEAAASLLEAGARTVTVIADREGDVYEEFAIRPAGVELLIRAGQDRRIDSGGSLFAAAAAPVLGTTTVALPAAPGRRKREAKLVLRAREVTITCPNRPLAHKQALPARVTLTVIEACEIDPPDGVEPAHWRLLSTEKVSSLADAERLVGFYRQRWTIEQLFRTCKTKGFDIEAVRIEDPHAFANLAAATLIAAIRVMQLVHERDGGTGRPLHDAFDPADAPVFNALNAKLEGATARQKNPHPPATLAHAAWVIARLGGWTIYYGKPGPVVMLHGLIQFEAIRQGWNLQRNVRIR